LLAMLNIGLAYQFRERTIGTFNRVGAREEDFQRYAEALETIAVPAFKAGGLRGIGGELTHRGRPAHAWMKLLDFRVDLSDVRHSAYLYLPLAAFFLWDFHVLLLLEKWQRDAGAQARGWLMALGRFEALAALANLKFEQPDWCFPEVNATADRFAAEGLGHPLIADAQRVGNDVEVGPAGTFLLVTGSNMSGKSTLLRSIGVNTVLAQAGGPVAATRLRLPPVTLATSILVEDSLADGVSFFMA